jgi:CHAT domain-containing protein/Tfp pilus assembly protein PilF
MNSSAVSRTTNPTRPRGDAGWSRRRFGLVCGVLLLCPPAVAPAQPAASAPSPASSLSADQRQQFRHEAERRKQEALKLLHIDTRDVRGDVGFMALAEAQAKLALEREHFGPVDPGIADSLVLIALAHQSRRDYAAARQARQQEVAVKTKLYGAQHWQVVDARLALVQVGTLENLGADQKAQYEDLARFGREGHWYYFHGDLSAARTSARKRVETLEKLVGPNDPDYLEARAQLEWMYEKSDTSDRAEPFIKKTLELRKKLLGEEHPAYAHSLTNLAWVLCDSRDEADQAEKLLNQALHICEKNLGKGLPADACLLTSGGSLYSPRAAYARALVHLGRFYTVVDEYPRAEPLLTDAAAILRGLVQKIPSAHLHKLNYVGELYRSRDDCVQADHDRGMVLSYATCLTSLADLCAQRGCYALAKHHAQEARHLLELVWGVEHPNYAMSLVRLGKLSAVLADYAEADLAFRTALPILKKLSPDARLPYANAVSGLGVLARERGDYSRADQYLREALQVYEERLGTAHVAYADCLNQLGWLLYKMGDSAAAESALQQALAIHQKKTRKRRGYGAVLNNLGTNYSRKGDFAKARQLLQHAVDISRALGERTPGYATSLSNLGMLCAQQGDLGQAESDFQQALEIKKAALGEEHPEYARSLNNLGNVYRARGQNAEAERLLRQAFESRRNKLGEEYPDSAGNLIDLADVYQATGRPQEARAALARALEIQEINLRRVFSFSAEPAMRAYLASVASSHGLDRLVSTSVGGEAADRWSALTWTLRRKGMILDAMCRFQDAERSVARDREREQQVEQWRSLRQQLADVALNPLPDTKPDVLRGKVAAWRAQAERLEAQLTRALSSQNVPPETVDAVAVQARLPEGSALIEVFRASLRDPGASGRAPRWKPAHYFAFALTAPRNTAPLLVDLGEARAIDQAIASLRAQVQRLPREISLTTEKSLEEEFRAASAKLYHQLFAPLRERVGSAGVIYLALDGELNRLPFEALVDDRGKYLLEDYRFAYLTSGRDLLRPAARPGRGTVVFAGPDYNLEPALRQARAKNLLAELRGAPHAGTAQRPVAQAPASTDLVMRGVAEPELRGLHWTALKGAAAEAVDIEQALHDSPFKPVQAFVAGEALEEVFKGLHGPRLLHVATHGFFLPYKKPDPADQADFWGAGLDDLQAVENPLLRCGLVLAGANARDKNGTAAGAEDGWVTGEEIALMDLSGTELVVLSACESGLGDVGAGEGVYGLRRAFLYAGARTLLVSLFKVPDTETRMMMRQFYRELVAGNDTLEAFHRAQLEIIHQRRAEHGAAHPFFWASFLLVGGPR